MTDNPQTEYVKETREINTWCGECMTYQPHTETLFDDGGKMFKCHVCHIETYTGKRKDAGADNAQVELFS